MAAPLGRNAQIALFFGIFSVIVIGMNSYALSQIFALLGRPLPGHFLLGVLIISFAFPFSLWFEKTYPNIISKILYFLSTIWLGVLLLFIPLTLLFRAAASLLGIPLSQLGPMVLAITIFLSIASIINAYLLSVRIVPLSLPGLKRNFRLIQLSDIHIGTIRNAAYLRKIAKKTNELSPDAIVITGDLVDGSAPLGPHLFDPLNALKAPVFYITGNHEYYEGMERVYGILEEHTTFTILRDQVKELGGIQFIGVEYSPKKDHLGKALQEMTFKKNLPKILLHHVPESISSAEKAGIDLMLCGHTHNGQIFPFNFLVRLQFRFIKGLYKIGNTKLYVSPGTGTWGPYMRLGSRNEIMVFELKKKENL